MGLISQNLNPFLSPTSSRGIDLRQAAMNMVQVYQGLPLVERDDFIAQLIPGSGKHAPESDAGAHLRAFLAIYEASGPADRRPTPSQVLAGIEVYIRASLVEQKNPSCVARMATTMWIKSMQLDSE